MSRRLLAAAAAVAAAVVALKAARAVHDVWLRSVIGRPIVEDAARGLVGRS